MQQAISKIIRDINQGASLSDALSKFPRIFDALYCDMIRAGEISGNVPVVLDRLIYIIEHEAKVRSDIKSALRYPIIVLIALAGAFVGLLTFVIPTFASVFISAGLDLPLPTKISMALYTFLSKYWYVFLGAIILIVLGLRFYFKTNNGKFVRDSFFIGHADCRAGIQKGCVVAFRQHLCHIADQWRSHYAVPDHTVFDAGKRSPDQNV